MSRLQDLENISRSRALDAHESAELARCVSAAYLRRRRLPGRIKRLRDRLAALEAELYPAATLAALEKENAGV